MPLIDALLPEFDREMGLTRKLLDRVPDGQFDWRPHPTSVTLGRPLETAYSIAARMRRVDPSSETGLMPIALVAGNRMVRTPSSFWRKSTSFFASGVRAWYSMPA